MIVSPGHSLRSAPVRKSPGFTLTAVLHWPRIGANTPSHAVMHLVALAAVANPASFTVSATPTIAASTRHSGRCRHHRRLLHLLLRSLPVPEECDAGV